MTPDAVLHFWFNEAGAAHWWSADPAFDVTVCARFGAAHAAAARGELFRWRDNATGRLAEVIVLDQFSRNIHRGTPAAFACDAVALVLAQEAVAAGADRAFAPAQRAFLYMPFMHSESLVIHDAALMLFRQSGLESTFDYEKQHRRIIERFGRYPHRNAILGRASTPEEMEFLKQSDSSF